ncbi:asparagine synthase (glutamine-hydrolyzing) [uncultured Ferrovibrio sp.]|jgi:asparagine synthase (glutamine-hydrolysing)|uniref:asparagine synthase (glutamine-hydrolyzing) n=1 Tax=uncultured Ferrovibrio sp. TaxID=1576913 RepID=UPI00261805D0|nr:asparagine synthase (glutamine-hydrolyzing) [uncultured Ferrovibrio sp.]
MCGIAGILTWRGLPADLLSQRVKAMTDAIAYRGPDADTRWVDAPAGLALGHRRLAIVDLTETGAQPMHSANERFVICYNGEIFNAAEVARDLPEINFRGHSDTEVLLQACAAWGVETAIKRFIGMFAFALWDRQERCLWLVRDRLGIKPLYWTIQDTAEGRTLLFGSELKALTAYPGWQPRLDRSALAEYLRLSYVPAPHSIYAGVRKLLPGHILRIGHDGRETLSCFWDLRQIAAQGQRNRDQRSEAEQNDALHDLLTDAVKRRMMADVPLGAFLSGGLDSSTVVALMQAQSSRPIKTFSIGFDEDEFSEAHHAAAVARHLGTDHTSMLVTPKQAHAVIPQLPDIYDEPFADSSQIPTFLVSQLARREVTVALSGDGGDEVFAGYVRYWGISRLWPWLAPWPRGLRAAAGRMLRMLSPAEWEKLLSPLPQNSRPRQLGDKIHKAATILAEADADRMYERLISLWPDAAAMVRGAAPDAPYDATLSSDLPEVVARLRYRDMTGYLPDDILTKVDRASMAVSLEARVPLLDHRVVEFAWTLPPDRLLKGGQGKRILRNVLYRYVPREMVERPKTGFGIPLGDWLRGPLRDWAEDLLSEQRLRADGLIDPAPVRQRWQDHLSGRRNGQHALWTVLMLQAWRARWPGVALD